MENFLVSSRLILAGCHLDYSEFKDTRSMTTPFRNELRLVAMAPNVFVKGCKMRVTLEVLTGIQEAVHAIRSFNIQEFCSHHLVQKLKRSGAICKDRQDVFLQDHEIALKLYKQVKPCSKKMTAFFSTCPKQCNA